MWKLFLSCSTGCLFLLAGVSCDKVDSLISEVTGGEELPAERRQGIKYVHDASVEDLKVWLAEPNVLVVLNFYSESSPKSMLLGAKLDDLAKLYAENVAIMKLNVGKPGDVATMAMNDYSIEEAPVLKFFLNGKEVDELKGAQDDETLDATFKKHIESIKGEFTLREGDLPGSEGARGPEDMMVRKKKGELPDGITRVRVPQGAKDITEGLPKSILGEEAKVPGAASPATPAAEKAKE